MTDSKIESAKKLLASGVPLKNMDKNLGVSILTLCRWAPDSARLACFIFLPRFSQP
jgi:hypothetical protein